MPSKKQPSDTAGKQRFPETKSEQPSKRSHQGVDQRGSEQDRIAGAKNHRRRTDAGEARQNAR